MGKKDVLYRKKVPFRFNLENVWWEYWVSFWNKNTIEKQDLLIWMKQVLLVKYRLQIHLLPSFHHWKHFHTVASEQTSQLLIGILIIQYCFLWLIQLIVSFISTSDCKPTPFLNSNWNITSNFWKIFFYS